MNYKNLFNVEAASMAFRSPGYGGKSFAIDKIGGQALEQTQDLNATTAPGLDTPGL